MQYYISVRGTTRWLDISIPSKVITLINLVAKCSVPSNPLDFVMFVIFVRFLKVGSLLEFLSNFQ